jgi:hypothetical protein
MKKNTILGSIIQCIALEVYLIQYYDECKTAIPY